MRRYLLCPATEGVGLGHLSQLLAIAEELTLRGHECSFVVNPNHAELLTSLGYSCFVAPVPRIRDSTVPDFRLCDTARALGISDPEYFADALAFEQAAIDDFRPDVMVSSTKLTAAVSAKSKMIPLLSVAATPDSPTFSSPLYQSVPIVAPAAGLSEIFSRYGLGDIVDVAELSFLRSDYRIGPFSQEFDPFLPVERLSYVGPLLSKAIDLYWALPSSPISGEDLVVVYNNRGAQPSEELANVVSCVASRYPSCRFVIVDSEAGGQRNASQNVNIVSSAPIFRLLQRAALFISGGGFNALLAALLTGTPIVGVPGRSAERDFNVRRVVELGAGVLVPGYPASFEDVVSAFDRVLRESAFQKNAILAGDKLRNLPGSGGVVDLLAAL
jgi:UDP:flavonoid glycosyltransferase YjiC (YdhE family)